ncbi:MAG: hypothetical protein LBQ44_08045 [Treponema sp.]|jgi:hypothetical protein|nr:hypothetical protein [Treponema sp.]
MTIRNVPVFPAFLAVLLVFGACTVSDPSPEAPDTAGRKRSVIQTDSAVSGYPEQLEELAELERSGGFVPGMGIAECKLREESGDYAGAVIAVYKELSWAYAHGLEGINREAIEEGLAKVGELEFAGSGGPKAAEEADKAARAALDFFNGRWTEAQALLTELFPGETEPDSFIRWMLLVCSLEGGGISRETRSAYGAVRARYSSFPEYWYRGARTFSGNAAGDYAERCIDLAGSGPFAPECRSILARVSGLGADDGKALRTRAEIEGLIQDAVIRQKPELLEDILPLIALPDNLHTIYAAGILRALTAEPMFKSWLNGEAEKARGRLAERLEYITGTAL